MKTSELIGPALDWAVAKCESLCLGEDLFGLKPIIAAPVFIKKYKPSTNWEQGGPIIEREIEILEYISDTSGWEATKLKNKSIGPTPLIAAMRCFATSYLGNEIEIPNELLI